jgi:hypothetical protein
MTEPRERYDIRLGKYIIVKARQEAGGRGQEAGGRRRITIVLKQDLV